MTSDESAPKERPRGILTEADREFLRNSEEYSRQAAHARQNAILERTRNAILDFTLLWEQWDHDERWDRRDWWQLRGLDQRPTYDEPIDDRALEGGLRDMAALALFLARADTLFRPEEPQPAEFLYIDKFLLLVFRRLGREYRRYVRDYNLEIEGEDLMWGQIQRALEEGEEVPAEKLLLALEMDTLDVDPEPIREAIQEVFRTQLQDDQSSRDGG